ncbi:unnamed protein product [Acanthoscelides obtectus]|uniref:Mitochondrial thiamine pyrophosphate carrier n=1 Tax=Acanthoscelides obtectus TaxID=200917 RepID=A0A9P0PT69_ACAOB|nr:unnamed protein product [Acanthoscelides obtectus]CAK1669560.1 Mitochondrial thiamine pyrophosphate carrier [Acanthoscelides obtectus]
MVDNEQKKEKLSHYDFAFAGGLSGFITRALCQPLDVLKIRFQLQVEPISNNAVSKYRSVFQAVTLILKEEGMKAFWKGHIPAQFLSVSYGVVQFWCFEALSKEAHNQKLLKSLVPVINFSSGFIAGGLATLASFPFDVIRTRLVAQSEQKRVYNSFIHCAQELVKKEGPMVMFRGLWPTVLQVGPHAGIQFMCYKFFNDLYKLMADSSNTSFSNSLVSGSLAGLCAKTSIYPFDLVKKRLQIQGFEEGRNIFGKTFQCSGMTDCLVRIYQVEGVPGFFKGLQPSLIKAVCTSALHFSTYEMTIKCIGYFREQ